MPNAPFPVAVEAIRGGRCKCTVAGHLELEGCTWPDIDSSLLFVRAFYRDFFECCLHGLRKGRTIVTGPPGIGKSAFGLFLVYMLVASSVSFVYHQQKSRMTWLVVPGRPTLLLWQSDKIQYITELEDPTMVLISDSLAPPSVRAPTVVITSQLRDRDFDKLSEDGFVACFLPIFSHEETLALDHSRLAHLDPSCVMINNLVSRSPGRYISWRLSWAF